MSWLARINARLKSFAGRLGTAIAIALRAALINLVLLPLSILALALHHRSSRRVA
jgi:hypothetical protein